LLVVNALSYPFAVYKSNNADNKPADAKSKSDGGGDGLVSAYVGLAGGYNELTFGDIELDEWYIGLVSAKVKLYGGSNELTIANVGLALGGSELNELTTEPCNVNIIINHTKKKMLLWEIQPSGSMYPKMQRNY